MSAVAAESTSAAVSACAGGELAGLSLTAAPLLRLAIYFNPKKRAQFLRPLFTQSEYAAREPTSGAEVRVQVVIIESDAELAQGAPFDMLLMKLTDIMTCALYSDDTAARRAAHDSLEAVRDTIAAHPAGRLTTIESFECVAAVLNRATIQTLVQRMQIRQTNEHAARCTIPDAFLYQHGAAQNSNTDGKQCSEIGGMPILHALPPSVKYPVICKSVAACGTPSSHRMYVLQRSEDFDLLQAHAAGLDTAAAAASSAAAPSSPATAAAAASSVWLVQQYVNHGGVIYKVYVLDEEVHVVARPSLPDLSDSAPPYFLNSQDMKLRELRPPHATTDKEGEHTATTTATPSPPPHNTLVPDTVHSIARVCASELREHLHLSLFGFDLIRSAFPDDDGLDTYNLIDINYFPSYKTLTGLPQKLIDICLARRERERRERGPTRMTDDQ